MYLDFVLGFYMVFLVVCILGLQDIPGLCAGVLHGISCCLYSRITRHTWTLCWGFTWYLLLFVF